MLTLVKALREHKKPVGRYLRALAAILDLDARRGWIWHDDGRLERAGDVLTDDQCALCRDEQWWQENYGAWWEEARWWYCGPLGWNCDYSEGARE